MDAKEPSSTMLYVSNLPFSFEDADLKAVFSGFEVTSAYVATRRNGRSKGFGFVTFSTPDQQKKALSAVDGKDLDGRTLTVKVAHKDDRRDARGELKEEFKTDTREPRKPRRERSEGNNAGERRAPVDRKPLAEKKPSETVLYVSNLPFEFTDEELGKVFAAHNPTSARIARRRNDRSKGFGFVEFATHKDQTAALALDGHTIGDRQISVKVSVASERTVSDKADGGERKKREPREPREPREQREPRTKAPRAPKEGGAAAPRSNNNNNNNAPAELSETTVYVSNVPFDLTDKGLEELFSSRGHKTTAAHIARKRDERSKGFGFVQLASNKDQQAALALDGMNLQDRAISVKVAKKGSETRAAGGEGKGNVGSNNNNADGEQGDRRKRQPRKRGPRSSGEGAASNATPVEKKASDTLVYVSNLSFDVDDNALAKLFDGLTIKSAHVAVRRNGRSKGFGFVELASKADQAKALTKSGTELSGRPITVEIAHEKKAE